MGEIGTFDIAKLELAPGDVLVVRAPVPLPAQVVVHIRDAVRAVTGPEQKVLVLDGGVDLAVLTRADLEAMD